MTDPRTAALAEALHLIRHMHGNLWPPTDACGCKDEAAAILAALPPDWCGHADEINRQRLVAIDGCIAIVQQSLDTVRGEDDGESRAIRASVGAREHVIRLLTGYRAALAQPEDDR
jgi:hypothetical protein